MKIIKFIFPLVVMCFLTSCTTKNLVDTNNAIAENSWAYAKSAKATLTIKDSAETVNIYFKLRHTDAYRYSNLFVLVHIKGNGLKKSNRYQFKLAQPDGEWLGKGSGDIYTHNFSLLTNYRFPKPGNYQIEIEQNMRDNPLIGISDVGITVEKADL